MIVELCGNPGCGKSTVAEIVERELSKRGYSVINIHKQEKAVGLRGKLRHLQHSLGYRYAPRQRAIKKALRSYARHNPTSAETETSINKVLEVVYSISQKRYLYDFLLMDEGAIQHLSMLVHTHKLRGQAAEIMALLNDTIYDDAKVFLCTLDTETNLERIRGRARSGDRFLSDSEEQMSKLLAVKNYNIRKAYSYLPETVREQADVSEKDTAAETILNCILGE